MEGNKNWWNNIDPCRVLPLVFWPLLSIFVNYVFASTPMRKGRDGEKTGREKWEKKEKNYENSGH